MIDVTEVKSRKAFPSFFVLFNDDLETAIRWVDSHREHLLNMNAVVVEPMKIYRYEPAIIPTKKIQTPYVEIAIELAVAE